MLGVYPEILYRALPYAVEFVPYTAPHVMEMLLVIATTGVAFYWTRDLMKGKPSVVLDVDWSYRMGSRAFMWCVRGPVGGVAALLERSLLGAVGGVKTVSAGASGFDNAVLDGAVNFVPERGVKRTSFSARWSDNHVVDGVIDWLNVNVLRFGDWVSRVQTGLVQNYILLFALGVLLLAILSGKLGGWV